jgi:hypothetical protein
MTVLGVHLYAGPPFEGSVAQTSSTAVGSQKMNCAWFGSQVAWHWTWT